MKKLFNFNMLLEKNNELALLWNNRKELALMVQKDTGWDLSHVALMDVIPLLWNVVFGFKQESGACFSKKNGLLYAPGVESMVFLQTLLNKTVAIKKPVRKKVVMYLTENIEVSEVLARQIAWQAFCCFGQRKNSLGILYVPKRLLPRLKELLFSVTVPSFLNNSASLKNISGARGFLTFISCLTPIVPNNPFPAISSEPIAFPGPVLSLIPYEKGIPQKGIEFDGQVFFHLDVQPPNFIGFFSDPVPDLPILF